MYIALRISIHNQRHEELQKEFVPFAVALHFQQNSRVKSPVELVNLCTLNPTAVAHVGG